MQQKGILAVDDSNTHDVPCVYAAVYSTLPGDRPGNTTGSYGKCRAEKIDIRDALGERDFRYIIIPEDQKHHFELEGLWVMVLTDFIRNISGIEQVLVDGQHKSSLATKVKEAIWPRSCPEITFYEHGDEQSPILNVADMLAYYFYRNHARFGGPNKSAAGFSGKELQIDFDDYVLLKARKSKNRPQPQMRRNNCRRGNVRDY
ncbi:MAG: hypothetical protein KJ709_01335 [Nanoarchaeota archaeon]|nr:hypothetical protein [Nanoarchaeota archaeon]